MGVVHGGMFFISATFMAFDFCINNSPLLRLPEEKVQGLQNFKMFVSGNRDQ
jgi:hypothetical protein